MRLIFQTVLLCLVGLALAKLDITNEWDEGYQATLTIRISEATHDWSLVLEFDRSLEKLEVFVAHIESQEDNRIFTLANESWDADFPPNTDFPLEFIVRHAVGAVPKLVKATFNGAEVDVGNGPVDPTQPTTTSGPTGPTTTTTTTTRKPSPPGEYDYGEVLGLSLRFYEAQRTGKLPADNRISWRGDSFVDDGKDVGLDLTGGYFDAGDHVKFGFPMAAMTTLLGWGMVAYPDAYEKAGELDNGLKALRWSLDYFIKAHPSPNEFYGQVGDGNVDHAFWGRPEEWPAANERPSFKVTASAPGSELTAETAAAFVTGYLIFKERDAAYAAECLRHAIELYDFANTYRGKYTDSITNAGQFYGSWSGYGDELGWGAAWLYRATGDDKYLDDVKAHTAEFNLMDRPIEFGWDDKKAGLHVLLAQITGDAVYVNAAKAFCDYIVNDVPRSPKGLAYISQWGSLRHAGNVAFVCLQAADAGINAAEYRDFARSQINYILGDTGRSFVVGYGVNPPQRPHHRASSCPDRPIVCDWNSGMSNPGPNGQVLTGALVGGPDGQDVYVDDRNDYVKNEVATDYNAGFQGALAGLYHLEA